jgi:hypothetical protein
MPDIILLPIAFHSYGLLAAKELGKEFIIWGSSWQALFFFKYPVVAIKVMAIFHPSGSLGVY